MSPVLPTGVVSQSPSSSSSMDSASARETSGHLSSSMWLSRQRWQAAAPSAHRHSGDDGARVLGRTSLNSSLSASRCRYPVPPRSVSCRTRNRLRRPVSWSGMVAVMIARWSGSPPYFYHACSCSPLRFPHRSRGLRSSDATPRPLTCPKVGDPAPLHNNLGHIGPRVGEDHTAADQFRVPRASFVRLLLLSGYARGQGVVSRR